MKKRFTGRHFSFESPPNIIGLALMLLLMIFQVNMVSADVILSTDDMMAIDACDDIQVNQNAVSSEFFEHGEYAALHIDPGLQTTLDDITVATFLQIDEENTAVHVDPGINAKTDVLVVGINNNDAATPRTTWRSELDPCEITQIQNENEIALVIQDHAIANNDYFSVEKLE